MSYRDSAEAREAVRRYEEMHMTPRWPYREEISAGGGEGCEFLIRRTLVKALGCKVLLHHFLPNGRDIDRHCHPASFLTVILKGSYVDDTENGRELLKAGMVRWRRAEHQHTTYTGSRGAWTLVFMARKRRPWGFYRDGFFYHWHEYVERFGAAMRCDD